MPQKERTGLQKVMDGAKEDLGVSKSEEVIRSNEHLLRLGCASVMFLFGFVIIIIHYLLVFTRAASPSWDKEEMFLVLVLVGGSIGVVFTKTLLAILNVVWPFQKRK